MLFSLEKVLVLKNVAIFEDVSESALSDFISVLEEVAFSKNKIILQKGDENKYLYIILTGAIQIKDGENVLGEVGAQEIFGEITALDPAVVDVTVTAIEETLALRVSSENLYEIMALHPNIAKGIIKTLVNRLKVLDNRHI